VLKKSREIFRRKEPFFIDEFILETQSIRQRILKGACEEPSDGAENRAGVIAADRNGNEYSRLENASTRAYVSRLAERSRAG
jgi:hypothetical protein